jgi:hypothetical protein
MVGVECAYIVCLWLRGKGWKFGEDDGWRIDQTPTSHPLSLSRSLPPNTPSQVNKRLPGWQDPPSRDQIRKALAVFDTNRDGVLSEHEFTSFAKDLVKAGPSAVFQRTAWNAAKTMGGMPAAAIAMKELQKRAPELLAAVGLGPVVKAMPVEMLAPFIGVATKFVRGMIPV